MSQHPRLEDAIRTARRRAAELGERAGEWGDELGARARELRAHLPPVRLPELRRAPPPPPPPPPPPSRPTAAVAVPALLIAAGAGLGWYAWRLWSQSRARERLDREGGEQGRAHPEAVMAHNPVPADAPVETPDPSASGLATPAEAVMAHAPAPTPDSFKDGGEDAAPSTAAVRPVAGPAPSEGELLASVSPAGFDADAAPQVAPTPTLEEAVKPRAPRKPKPPGVSA